MKIELDELLAYGVDVKNRRIYFGSPLDGAEESIGDFTQASIELAVRALHKLAADAPGKPIELYINSYGGSPYDMLRLYDEILANPCQIRFIGSGVVMSAATWIMVACDERYLHPNTTIMVHDGTDGFEGKHTDAQIQAAEMKRLQELLYDIYAVNSRMPREFWEDVCQRDLYLTAEEAIALGIADKIIEPKKRGNLRRMRQANLKKTPSNKDMKSLVHKLYSRINKLKIPKIEMNEPKKEPVDPNIVLESSGGQENKNAPAENLIQPVHLTVNV